ncbi:MAG: serine/threonine protein kinase [Cellulomonadaceae bacterium]|jgi:serine/threonine-protein kinase|nr:serine/threonine protein kinase [Cellulomonadaceae bacterium]
MKPEPGVCLGKRYTLTRLIAAGGMGEVWAAEDTALHREVAIKVLREEYTGNEEFLARLRVEAKNAAALSHPNIAHVHDYGEQDGVGYLVMELVHGEPLADLLEREPVLPPEKLLPILAASARGLHHAHLAGVVHRDVKPGNILLAESGTTDHPDVKITDFGVSLAANQAPMTATGMVMGTAQYLSPEQAIGKKATALSDIYALGVIAYEATNGKRPFTGKSPVDIAVAHVNSPVPLLKDTVDPELRELIMQVLDKDPAHRPQSAGELAERFDEVLAHIKAKRAAAGATASPSTPRDLPAVPSGPAGQAGSAGTPGSAGSVSPTREAPGPTPPVPGTRRAVRENAAARARAVATAGSGSGLPPASPTSQMPAESRSQARRAAQEARKAEAARRRRTRLIPLIVVVAVAIVILIATLTRGASAANLGGGIMEESRPSLVAAWDVEDIEHG